MTHSSLVNLTLPVVIQEIKNVLAAYPKHPYQSSFSIPELHQKLVAYVLSQVPNRQGIKETQGTSIRLKADHHSLLQERLLIDMIIRGGILYLLRENAGRPSHHLPRV